MEKGNIMQVYPVGRDVCSFFRKINGKELSYKQLLEIKNMQLHRAFDTLWRIKESSPDTKMILQHNPNGFGENTEPTIERVVTYQEEIVFEIRSHVYQLILARAYEWEQNAKVSNTITYFILYNPEEFEPIAELLT